MIIANKSLKLVGNEVSKLKSCIQNCPVSFSTYRHVEEALCRTKLVLRESWDGVLLGNDRVLILLLRRWLAVVKSQEDFAHGEELNKLITLAITKKVLKVIKV